MSKFTEYLKETIAADEPTRIAQALTTRKLLTFPQYVTVSGSHRSNNMEKATLIIKFLYERILHNSKSYYNFKKFLCKEESFKHLKPEMEKLG